MNFGGGTQFSPPWGVCACTFLSKIENESNREKIWTRIRVPQACWGGIILSCQDRGRRLEKEKKKNENGVEAGASCWPDPWTLRTSCHRLIGPADLSLVLSVFRGIRLGVRVALCETRLPRSPLQRQRGFRGLALHCLSIMVAASLVWLPSTWDALLLDSMCYKRKAHVRFQGLRIREECRRSQSLLRCGNSNILIYWVK